MLQFLRRILVVLAVALALPAVAQSDPPGRVGRLAFIENQVFFRVDRSDQGGPATVNWPVSSGAIVETGSRGRAEIWVGSTAYRVGDNSQVEFMAVDDYHVDLRMNGGNLAVSILDRDQVNDITVITPDGNVRFQTPGRYRIDVYSDHSELSVQAGQATFDDRGRPMPVAAGQKVSSWGNGSIRVDSTWDQDNFDRWVAHRENLMLASVSRRYVSPGMTGYQDLDTYGDWQTAPDYGAVWYPRGVADDWAPYRDGRWAWVDPWGWTWVDQAPWGFAPFHYGRWAMIQGRWGWVPGRPAPRPVYAPALVGWIGNPGWSVSFSSGSAPAVGWFPLAPREVYVPSYRYSQNYVRQINVSHVADVSVINRVERGGAPQAFVNNTSPRAVTVVPANLLREGRPVTASEVRRSDRLDLGRAPLASRAPSTDWLAPKPGAVRPQADGRRDQVDRPPRRDFEAPRQTATERVAPVVPGNPNQPAFRPPTPDAATVRGAEPRREGQRGSPEIRQGAENRGRPVNIAPAAPAVVQPQDIRQAPPVPVPMRRDMSPPDVRSEERQARPVPPQDIRQAAPAPAPMRREMPPPDVRSEERQARPIPPQDSRQAAPMPAPMRRDMPPQDVRSEERHARPIPPQEREQRQFQRPEPPAPREVVAPQVIRQPEMPRPAPAPEIRAPAPAAPVQPQRVEPPRQQPAPPVIRQPEMPRPAPPPAAPPVQQQRVEPPRQQQAPQQGGGQNEQHRRHEDERGGQH